MITQRAVLIGFVGFCFYLIALVNSLPPLYYTLAWLSAGILASSLGVALLSLQGLECRWRVAGGRASELLGEDAADIEHEGEGGARLEIEVSNSGTLNKTGVVLMVRLYDVRRNRMRTQRFLIEALPSGTSLSSELPLHASGHGLPRGRYYVSDAWLIGSDVLGLFRARKRASAELHRVRMYDNRVTPLSTLTATLEKATGHDHDVCAAVTFKAHLEGSAIVFRGVPGECRQVAGALRAVGLYVEELSDRTERRWQLTRKRPLMRQRRVRIGERVWSGKALEGLARQAALMPGTEFELVIGPAMVRPEDWGAFSAGAESHDGAASRLQGQGDEFKGTRPYTPGDDLRRVHWTSSARRGELVVREFLRTAQESTVVVWDGVAASPGLEAMSKKDGHLPPVVDEAWSEQGGEEAQREETGLRLTASLCRALLERGRPCGLLRADGHPLWLPPGGEGGVTHALGHVIEVLADARADRTANLIETLRQIPGVRLDGEVFLVTTAARDQLGAVLDAARLWRARGAQVRIAWVLPVTMKRLKIEDARLAFPEMAGVDVVLREAQPGESKLMPVREALGDMLAAYSTVRRFSAQPSPQSAGARVDERFAGVNAVG